jgi:DNA-binding transcriptional LysR family regulator
MDSRRLDLNLLITLEALLVERNVTRAAARLHLSQPAVSAQLSRLRDMFGDTLLIPAQRGMTPTAKALELLDPLRQALDQVRATVATHKEFDPGAMEMILTIACTDYPQVAVVMPLIKHLRTSAPGVKVALLNLNAPELDAQMARGDVDLAFMTPETAPPTLRAKHLLNERYVLIARHGHPTLRDTVTIETFAQLEHVIVSPRGAGFASPVDDALAALGLARKVVLSSASFLFVTEIVSESDLVALVPERLTVQHRHKLTTLECPVAIDGFSLSMVWHERNQDHGGHRWIRDTVAHLFAGKSASAYKA